MPEGDKERGGRRTEGKGERSGREEKKHKTGTRQIQQSQECTKNHLLTADMHSQALCFRCKKGGQRSGAGMVTAGLPVRGASQAVVSRERPPHPHSLPTTSSFLLLVNDFLSGPGSPKDGRVGVGYLIEGCCDCSRFKLEPWSLCSFLFCGFSEIHIGPSKGRAISETTSHWGACSPVTWATPSPAS